MELLLYHFGTPRVRAYIEQNIEPLVEPGAAKGQRIRKLFKGDSFKKIAEHYAERNEEIPLDEKGMLDFSRVPDELYSPKIDKDLTREGMEEMLEQFTGRVYVTHKIARQQIQDISLMEKHIFKYGSN